MSFVTDHIRRIDGQLDSFQLPQNLAPSESAKLQTASDDTQVSPKPPNQGPERSDLHRLERLQASIRALTTASSLRTILDPPAIVALLRQADLLDRLDSSSNSDPTHEANSNGSSQEEDLEWMLVSKATTQIYGLVLKLLLDEIVPLSSDIRYWDEILSSYIYTALYTIQTSPLRFWSWVQSIMNRARYRLRTVEDTHDGSSSQKDTLIDRWSQFYAIVKDSICKQSLTDMQSKLMSPLTISQLEAKSKRKHLKRLREMSASGLGILVDEGMMLDSGDEASISSKARSDEKEEWKSVVSKSVSLMEAVLRNITILEMGPGEFEETVFMNIDEENGGAQSSEDALSQPVQIALRLQQLLDVHIPAHLVSSSQAAFEYGRPSRILRYWLPAIFILSSGSTIFRVLMNRKVEIVAWIHELGTTLLDFWSNWVLEPSRKVISTIRHDKDSEIAIMSKESLKGDKASLERMVVQFVTDNPKTSDGTMYTEAQLADVRAKVGQGDLTPVLRAYEKDLRRPFVGTIKGDLIRALLIQIQKTKVDVEVALGGIDNLLKSQELVFGFIGVTPGIIFCVGTYQYFRGIFLGRRGRLHGRKQGSMIQNLRNVDRILTASTPHNNMLSYKEHGLLLCEVHVLRQKASKVLPVEINRDFLEEVHDLVELRTGVERQLRVVERIRWAYAKYLV